MENQQLWLTTDLLFQTIYLKWNPIIIALIATNLISISVAAWSAIHVCSSKAFCCCRTQTLKSLFQFTAHKANTVWLYKGSVDTKKNPHRPNTSQVTRQNKSRSVHIKATTILLWCYLVPGCLQLSLQSRLVLAKVPELPLCFTSELTGLLAEVGFWGTRVKTTLWVGQDLLPLDPKHQNGSNTRSGVVTWRIFADRRFNLICKSIAEAQCRVSRCFQMNKWKNGIYNLI